MLLVCWSLRIPLNFLQNFGMLLSHVPKAKVRVSHRTLRRVLRVRPARRSLDIESRNRLSVDKSSESYVSFFKGIHSTSRERSTNSRSQMVSALSKREDLYPSPPGIQMSGQ